MTTQRSILITGCSSGIGFELIEPLLSRGWTVIASMRRMNERRSLFSALEAKASGKLILIELDVTQRNDIKMAAEFVQRNFPDGLDCLVNNAGFGVFGPLELASTEQIQNQYEVNVIGLVNLSKALLPSLRKAKGKLVNVASVLGFIGLPQSSLYCSSKFAVEGISEALYHELKPHGVKVAVIEPGGFRTKFGENITWAESRESSAEVKKTYEKETGLLRAHLLKKLNKPGNSLDPLIKKIIRVVESENPSFKNRAGLDCQLGHIAFRLLPLPVRLKITEIGMALVRG